MKRINHCACWDGEVGARDPIKGIEEPGLGHQAGLGQ